jgi:hypothetical protein
VGADLVVKPKRACCASSPRCKRCPVVCRRLAAAGRAERRDDGRYVLDPSLRKKELKAARRRKKPKPGKLVKA